MLQCNIFGGWRTESFHENRSKSIHVAPPTHFKPLQDIERTHFKELDGHLQAGDGVLVHVTIAIAIKVISADDGIFGVKCCDSSVDCSGAFVWVVI